VAGAVVTAPLAMTLDVSAVPAQPGGAGYYTMALASGLAARDDVALTLLARRGDTERWPVLAGRASLRAAVPASRPGRLVFEQLGFPSTLRSLGVALHHGPHYTMPHRAPVPCVVTIHDCTFFDHPEWHLPTKAVFFRRAIRRAALDAKALVCVSQVTADRLHASCPVRPPVVVAPHGVDHERFGPTEPAPGFDQRVLEAAGVPLDRPLVVFVGTLERIVRTGYLAHDAVPALLRQATVVAYPALEEGFGLPALEALACGAPLITTAGTAMAEVAGGAARLVSPGNVPELADALDAALAQVPGRPERQRGIEVAAGYTWEASVALHLQAYAMAGAASQ
jgi:glycosyltransferase involved in cell wall biosynthesis